MRNHMGAAVLPLVVVMIIAYLGTGGWLFVSGLVFAVLGVIVLAAAIRAGVPLPYMPWEAPQEQD